MLGRLVDVKEGEGVAAFLSFLFLYVLMTGYYILKPVRDALGLELGTKNLPWLFLATMVAVYLANFVYGALVARWDRRRLIATVYRFFALNLLAFAILFRLEGAPGFKSALIVAYFQWVSVFNLFVVAIFWSFMNDVWTTGQARRLFGLIAAGGMAGALSGGAVTAALVRFFRPEDLLAVSAVALEGCVQAMMRIEGLSGGRPAERAGSGAVGPGCGSGRATGEASVAGSGAPASDGLGIVLGSRYLTLLATFMLLLTISNTFQYFQLNTLVEAQIAGKAARTSYFALQNVAVNVISLAVVFLTGPILTRYDVRVGLLMVPAVMAAGSALSLLVPGLWVVTLTYVLASGLHYSINRAARELLYTPTAPHEKYTAKSFIDTFVYRAGDAAGAAMAGLIAGSASTLAALVLVSSLLRAAVIWPLGAQFRTKAQPAGD